MTDHEAVKLRKKYPALQKAWDRYKTVWHLVNDEDYADETYPTIESVIDVLKIILKKYLISTITNRIKDTHNEQDIADLQTFSLEELQEIQNDLIDA